ncbi:MAG: serine/threonine protein kinase, partial [Candidatus Obscuribacterales bacterium]|nr:serine/threonine protein kinase [Candidatus Obscuribacterales bacterium]
MTAQVLADKYEILDVLGTGGMGVVYKARHLLMKRIVAIKMLHESLTANEVMRKRFEQEAQAISSLNHPNILTVYDFGITEDNKPYLVVEFLEGTSLEEVLNDEGAIDSSRVMHIFKQATSGLAQAHEKGIIHRDLKPGNIMLITVSEQPDFVKIVDFGIAKLVQESTEQNIGLTATGEVFGSPLYMSPEQCRGRKLDNRSDIYSLGCVMYHSLSGKRPFNAQDLPECLYKQVHEEPPKFSEIAPELN